MPTTTRHAPFAIERPLPGRLAEVLDYWRSLLRGEATIPFTDDVDWTRVRALCPDVFLLGVFEKPERFRFIDEVDLPSPLEFLRAQADAATEGMAPTVYQHTPKASARGYARLLLPCWGEGKVSALIGAVEYA